MIGIDDWAWKRGQRYGSIICDLERRRVVDLLPDREPATVEAWLAHHPEITIISRDRGGGYGRAATRAAPQAVQVADRWHLMENASAAFLEAVRRSMRPVRIALGTTSIDPALLTHAERLQHDAYLRREEAYVIIRTLAKTGTPIKEIVRRTGRSRKLVRDIVRGGGAMYFAAGRMLWSRTSPGLMRNGRPAAAMVPSCGDGSGRQPAFVAACALSPNGQPGVGMPKVPDAKGYASHLRPGY